ncbi:YheC/YheD family protein [Paenibacillus radicis (ex Xue et al. 2023)]|uniref:YheC/YheD family protein n=1 Tax=Paenibacillus radicis (ex Xue et al. 2023) TaxID=2972489 RepID=A0ABT1YN29_9BACL|nr:YheC/YheD family protein [Paenibacillus radicis (ex Xue et al. 2023)]MCR8634582.1 YheC/YheD family protein [Paenibacillus radicis (ex Xue et al. 2023)]
MKKVKYKMGKLGKHNFMKKFDAINAYLPDTRLATKSNIKTMISLYESLYLKPDEGTGGHGIYKLTKTNNGYSLRSGTTSKSFSSIGALYDSHQLLFTKNKYIVQEGIDLLKHNKRAFDIRVMVQKNRNKELVPTGIIGRLAKPKKIVTNYHSGGTPLPIETLLKSHLKSDSRKQYIQKIVTLGIVASKVLGKSYKSKRAFGVDIAIDSKMKPWILEINTQPDMSIFNTLKDKTMYRRILRYSK